MQSAFEARAVYGHEVLGAMLLWRGRELLLEGGGKQDREWPAPAHAVSRAPSQGEPGAGLVPSGRLCSRTGLGGAAR